MESAFVQAANVDDDEDGSSSGVEFGCKHIMACPDPEDWDEAFVLPVQAEQQSSKLFIAEEVWKWAR